MGAVEMCVAQGRRCQEKGEQWSNVFMLNSVPSKSLIRNLKRDTEKLNRASDPWICSEDTP